MHDNIKALLIKILKSRGYDRGFTCDGNFDQAIDLVCKAAEREGINLFDPNHQSHPRIEKMVADAIGSIVNMEGCDRPFCTVCKAHEIIDDPDNNEPLPHLRFIFGDRAESVTWLSKTLSKIATAEKKTSSIAKRAIIVLSLLIARSMVLETFAQQASDLLDENEKLRQTINMLLDTASKED